MIVHLLDGTYELFRHFYGLRRVTKGEDPPFGAVTGVLHTVLETIEEGATHLGVASGRLTGEAGGSSMRQAFARSLEWTPSSFPTSSRSSAIRRMDIRASRGSVQKPRRVC